MLPGPMRTYLPILLLLLGACGRATEPRLDPCPSAETWVHSKNWGDGRITTDTLCLPKGSSDWFITGSIP